MKTNESNFPSSGWRVRVPSIALNWIGLHHPVVEQIVDAYLSDASTKSVPNILTPSRLCGHSFGALLRIFSKMVQPGISCQTSIYC